MSDSSERETQQTRLTYTDRTELVNLRHGGDDGVVRIDRSTRFGNPFKMEQDGGEYTREGCIEAYREWFCDKIRNDPEFRQDVEDLRGATLACWCVPKPCHGDVILEYLRGEMDVGR